MNNLLSLFYIISDKIIKSSLKEFQQAIIAWGLFNLLKRMIFKFCSTNDDSS